MEILDPGQKPIGAVLVIHSWWGLTDSFRRYGASLRDAGFLVGLSDLFGGHLASTEAEARHLRSLPRRVPMYRTLGADLETLRRTGQGVGVVGFSMGGHWGVWLSQRPEYAVAATILYYAARGGDFTRCTANILAHFAATDAWVSKTARSAMERAVATAQCGYQAFDYPGTVHWFAESSRVAEFDGKAAQIACKRDILHLRQHLPGADALR